MTVLEGVLEGLGGQQAAVFAKEPVRPLVHGGHAPPRKRECAVSRGRPTLFASSQWATVEGLIETASCWVSRKP
jgi:hypothetical protein